MASVINKSAQAITINETAHDNVRLFIAEGLIFTTAPSYQNYTSNILCE